MVLQAAPLLEGIVGTTDKLINSNRSQAESAKALVIKSKLNVRGR